MPRRGIRPNPQEKRFDAKGFLVPARPDPENTWELHLYSQFFGPIPKPLPEFKRPPESMPGYFPSPESKPNRRRGVAVFFSPTPKEEPLKPQEAMEVKNDTM